MYDSLDLLYWYMPGVVQCTTPWVHGISIHVHATTSTTTVVGSTKRVGAGAMTFYSPCARLEKCHWIV